MQSLINISSSITVTEKTSGDVLAFTREVLLTGGRLGQW